jgi:hypothetical protein
LEQNYLGLSPTGVDPPLFFYFQANKEANAYPWVDDPDHPWYKKNTYITIEEDGTITLKEYMG